MLTGEMAAPTFMESKQQLNWMGWLQLEYNDLRSALGWSMSLRGSGWDKF